MKKMKLSMMAIAIIGTLISCGKDDKPEPTPPPALAVTDSMEIPFSTNSYALYSFKNKTQVANSDSATNKWDIGIRFVSIILNSQASGPGNAGVISKNGIYDSYLTAPETGYAYDTTAARPAINASFTNGWYNYNEVTHAFSPKAGLYFVIRTADNHYVKMEITAVNYAGYTPPNPTPTTLIYKFRYSYQENGRNF